MTARFILVLTTTDTEQLARAIAGKLVESNAAACVNIVSRVESVYRWQGQVCHAEEFLLLIKSTVTRFESICAVIRELHTYEVPEIISLPIDAGAASYLDWVQEQVSPNP